MSAAFLLRRAALLAIALLAGVAPDASAQRYPREQECGEGPAGAFPNTASYEPGQDTLAAVLRVVARSVVPQPTGVFLMTTDGIAARPTVQVVASNVPADAYPRLQQVAAAYVASHPPRERIFFWVELGGGGDLPIDHPVRFCSPHHRNRDLVHRYLQEAARLEVVYTRMGDAGTDNSRVGTVDLLVGRDGRVMWVGVDESSGSQPVDDYYLFIASQMRFTPGTIDGVPRVFRERVRMTVEGW
ncbi:MAG TPA: hypothetical protein VF615_29820 [Longimicrobiaceae bacterium]|jgi:hypothetical protein